MALAVAIAHPETWLEDLCGSVHMQEPCLDDLIQVQGFQANSGYAPGSA